MSKVRKLNMRGHKIWCDRNIKPECKRIFAYLYSLGFDKAEIYVNIGDIQPFIKIKNNAFKKNLEILNKFRYIKYFEYCNGMYEIHIY